MARQRRGQCLGQWLRHRRRIGALVAVLVALAGLACRGLPRDPVGLGEDDPNSVGGSRPSPLVGTWQVILLIDAGADLQRWTTRWTFLPTGQCHLNRKVDSQLEGTSRTTDRDCSYIDRGSLVEATYLDSGTTVAMPYSVPLNSTTQLVIEGVEYERAP